ncbi:molybdopterin cofactor-binding domain-containing protein [Rhizobium leguminosarum]|uniref:xanthine dehydrogenase family protein molybdopterin-binding subunit n=1 Tax=Rhizobium leguminosarum TaxID=384 RepID=UPI003F95B606
MQHEVPTSSDSVQLSRRSFLTAALTTAGAFSLGIGLAPELWATDVAKDFTPDAFIRILPTGEVIFVNAAVEMGQGTFTSIPMLIAEEMGIDVHKLIVEQAPADEKKYVHPIWKAQITGGSGSVRGLFEPMRKAAATARTMLVSAAATRWGVAPSECEVKDGMVLCPARKLSASYGELAGDAARLPIPADVTLKASSAFSVIGTAVKRTDTVSKTNGTAVFGIDVSLPGMKVAAIANCPVPGGKFKSIDEKAALAVPGVRQVVRLANAVAVVADHYGAARKALDSVDIQWDNGPNADLTTEKLVADIRATAGKSGVIAKSVGDVDASIKMAQSVFEAEYLLPMLAHAAMEPLNCTIEVREDGCDVWVGTQAPAKAQEAVASVLGVPADRVTVHNHLVGGGFGRKLDVDYIAATAAVAREVKAPVKVIWSREEDMQHDAYRAHNVSRIKVALDAKGMPIAFSHRVVGPAILARFLPIYFIDGVDLDIVDGALGAYKFPAAQVEFVRHEAPDGLLTGNWRGVGPTRNMVGVETVIDELAAKAGVDPVEYRRELLKENPRAMAALERVAEAAKWGEPRASGRYGGIVVQEAFGSYAALYAEISLGADKTPKVERIICAVDCGIVINPDTVVAQIQGGVLFGLTAALYGKITLSDGRIEQGNFDTYLPLRIEEAPPVEVHLIKSEQPPGGIGEVGTSLIAPAVLNAIAAGTGKRLRTLPIDVEQLKS